MDSLIVRHNMQTLAEENARFLSKVYLWMALGLALTAWLTFLMSSGQLFAKTNSESPLFFWGTIAAHLISLIYISAYLKKMNGIVGLLTFICYSALCAITFSITFVCFFENSIHAPLMALSFSFLIFSAISRMFKKDWGILFLIFGFAILEGIFLFTIKQYFPTFYASSANLKLNIISLSIVTLIICFDSGKIKDLPLSGSNTQSIHGALKLYADFLNLFLFFLRLSSRK